MKCCMHPFVLHNDAICEASKKVLAPGQVGLLSGWGVFSTLRVSHGVPFAFERHWERLKRDAAVLNVPFPEDPAPVRAGLSRLFEANQAYDATLRIVVVRNGGGMWEGPVERPFDLIALTTGLKDWGGGVKLAVQEQGRHAESRFRGVKMLSWALNLVMLETARQRGFDEVVLLNERSEVAECTSANIFIARGGAVWTPPLASGCLPGVTREVLLGEVKVEGIAIAEKTLFLRDLEEADEVFITSTTRNLLPVVLIEGRPLPRPGAIRDVLEAALERRIEAYVGSKLTC
jgi:branched-chain amino acid aminotransferase